KMGDPGRVALSYAPPYLLIVLLFRMVAPKAPVTPLCAVTLLASLAAVVPLVYQGKGWAYHAFAAISLALVAVLCRVAASSGWRYNRETLGRGILCVIVVMFAWLPFLQTEKPSDAFVAAVKAASKGEPTLGVIGSDIAAAHPLARIVGARFLSANNSDWFGALAYVLARKASAKGEVADAARYQKRSDAYLDTKYAEFASHNYDLIVIQQDEPLWTDYVLGQARFAALLSAYHPIARDERFMVYGRAAPADQSSIAR
ncbi:hypothetical protein PH547_13450, partial [Rhizobium sp. CNPSo 3464]|uniref:hypothetical protein n=1 Tax=Rhizobium sp. CNPSo 3464 TaxID=3021406 RepID=UPI002549C925